MHARWRQHFGDLEGGQAVSLEALARVSLHAQPQDAPNWPQPDAVEMVPTLGNLQRVLMSTKCAKAPGLSQNPTGVV